MMKKIVSMMISVLLLVNLMSVPVLAGGRVITVKQDGTGNYSTIQKAVEAARPGDTVEVYGGIYREQVIFPRGGKSEESRITLRAADGEEVTVTGSDVVTGWSPTEREGIWTVTLPKDAFTTDVNGEYFNPYANKWQSKVRGVYPSCGTVYLNGTALTETQQLTNSMAESTTVRGETVTNEVPGLYDTAMSWYATVNEENGDTVIWANFGDTDPNAAGNVVETNARKQVITAAWNQSFITIDGLKVTHGCGPKTINFAQMGSKSMAGALCTHGGYRWIIENCEVSDNRGVAVDFGLGSRGYMYDMCGYPKAGENPDPEPEFYGYHIIRNNYIHNNSTNGMMSYRGAYTEIYNNILYNNDDMNTGLASEAYVKNVNAGFGINTHDNYFYSDHSWDTRAIWYDTETDGSSISGNVFYANGPGGHGFSYVMWENGSGWNNCDNNIFVNVGFRMHCSANTNIVNNLFLNNTKGNDFPGSGTPSKAYGWNGYTRVLRAKMPGTLKTICIDGTDGNSHWETYCRFNKLMNNMFFGTGANSDESMLEVSNEEYNGKYYEFYNNVNVEDFSPDHVDPDAFSGLAADNWTPVRSDYQQDGSRLYGNECDYNVYYGGAGKINYQYGQKRGYGADANSVAVNGGKYTVEGDETHFKLTLNVDDSIVKIQAPQITGERLGKAALYTCLGVDFPAAIRSTDFFGNERTDTTVVGPFSKTETGDMSRVIGGNGCPAAVRVDVRMNYIK